MSPDFVYFSYECIPCRIMFDTKGEWGEAEIYELGEGLVPGPKYSILLEGRVISRERFHALVVELIQGASKVETRQ